MYIVVLGIEGERSHANSNNLQAFTSSKLLSLMMLQSYGFLPSLAIAIFSDSSESI